MPIPPGRSLHSNRPAHLILIHSAHVSMPSRTTHTIRYIQSINTSPANHSNRPRKSSIPIHTNRPSQPGRRRHSGESSHSSTSTRPILPRKESRTIQLARHRRQTSIVSLNRHRRLIRGQCLARAALTLERLRLLIFLGLGLGAAHP